MKALIAFMFVMLVLPFAHAKEYIVWSETKSTATSTVAAYKGRALKQTNGFVADLSDEQIAKLEKSGYKVEAEGYMKAQGFRTIELNTDISAMVSNDTAKMPWGVQAIGARKANEYKGGSGSGVTVCVVDTGVDTDHPALKGQIAGGYAAVKTTIPNAVAYEDDGGHGTHVSGTIAGRYDVWRGVAPLAKIYAVKVLDNDGSGAHSWIAEGIRACIGHSQIVNLSLGGGSYSAAIHDALKAAKKAGLDIFCAAGNSGEEGVIYPAKNPECIAVSAVDRYGRLGDFSTWGNEVDVAAPGVDIKSSVPGGGYETWNGTSMATPHVAGAAAIMRSRGKKVMMYKNLGLPANKQGLGQVDALRSAKPELK